MVAAGVKTVITDAVNGCGCQIDNVVIWIERERYKIRNEEYTPRRHELRSSGPTVGKSQPGREFPSSAGGDCYGWYCGRRQLTRRLRNKENQPCPLQPVTVRLIVDGSQ